MTPKIEEGRPPTKHSDEEIRQNANEYLAHSFIVKIWREEPAGQNETTTWRGRITHVPGGERRYLQNLNEVARFIAPYLVALGVRPGVRERIKKWFSPFKLFHI